MRTLNASEFKAKCLAILDEVERTGASVTLLKRGRPVAQVVPVARSGARYAQQELAGTARVVGDLIRPPLPIAAWEVLDQDHR
jgi:prevent-host-death family protein